MATGPGLESWLRVLVPSPSPESYLSHRSPAPGLVRPWLRPSPGGAPGGPGSGLYRAEPVSIRGMPHNGTPAPGSKAHAKFGSGLRIFIGGQTGHPSRGNGGSGTTSNKDTPDLARGVLIFAKVATWTDSSGCFASA